LAINDKNYLPQICYFSQPDNNAWARRAVGEGVKFKKTFALTEFFAFSSTGLSTTVRWPGHFQLPSVATWARPSIKSRSLLFPSSCRKQATSLQVIQGDDHCLPWFVALVVLGGRRSFNLSAVLVEQIRRLVEMCVIAGSHVLQCIVGDLDRNHGRMAKKLNL
jgi:hypothetical protein